MASSEVQYFLGANAPTGLYSLYDQLIDVTRASRVYILKGGPGCGKSTLMRRVAAMAREAGQEVEYIICSGDPDSLDGVILPGLEVAIVDGTSPHVVEPKYPGVVEQYVNLGTCYDLEGLSCRRGDIIQCMGGYKQCYQSAYRYLAAAGTVLEETRGLLLSPALEEKLAKRARGILSRELPRRRAAAPGQIKQRFLSAVTHKGELCLYATAHAQCGRVYELYDRYGLAGGMLQQLLEETVASGYDVVACPDPMAPQRLAHLLVPELGLAFLTATPATPFAGKAYRRIRLDAALDNEVLRRIKPRLRFAQKVTSALMEEAIVHLARAKSMHDDLEGMYNPYVDFAQVDAIALTLAGEIFDA